MFYVTAQRRLSSIPGIFDHQFSDKFRSAGQEPFPFGRINKRIGTAGFFLTARIEQELQAILRSGTDAIMVHELSSVLAVPEVLAVFRKYCSPE